MGPEVYRFYYNKTKKQEDLNGKINVFLKIFFLRFPPLVNNSHIIMYK